MIDRGHLSSGQDSKGPGKNLEHCFPGLVLDDKLLVDGSDGNSEVAGAAAIIIGQAWEVQGRNLSSGTCQNCKGLHPPTIQLLSN